METGYRRGDGGDMRNGAKSYSFDWIGHMQNLEQINSLFTAGFVIFKNEKIMLDPAWLLRASHDTEVVQGQCTLMSTSQTCVPSSSAGPGPLCSHGVGSEPPGAYLSISAPPERHRRASRSP